MNFNKKKWQLIALVQDPETSQMHEGYTNGVGKIHNNIKIIRDKKPTRLHNLLMQIYYSEGRNVARGIFYDSSKSRVGGQSLQNRLKYVALIKEPWKEINAKWTNDMIRVKLKRRLFHVPCTINSDIRQSSRTLIYIIFSQLFIFGLF